MTDDQFEATVRTLPRAAVISLRGGIDASAEQSLNSAYEEAESTEPEAILLDFAAAGYINSTGIALIVGVLARARKSHLRIMASGLSPHYRQVFEITRLTDFMDLYPDESAALAGLMV
jgi:anti-anti-sigma factor